MKVATGQGSRALGRTRNSQSLRLPVKWMQASRSAAVRLSLRRNTRRCEEGSKEPKCSNHLISFARAFCTGRAAIQRVSSVASPFVSAVLASFCRSSAGAVSDGSFSGAIFRLPGNPDSPSTRVAVPLGELAGVGYRGIESFSVTAGWGASLTDREKTSGRA